MKAEVFEIAKTSKRIKMKVPYEAYEWRREIKKIQGIWYHKDQKMWSVPNTPDNLKTIESIFGSEYSYISAVKNVKQAKFEMSEEVAAKVEATLTKMVLAGLSQHTIKTYRSELLRYFDQFKNRDMLTITKSEIEKYVFDCIQKYKIGASKQNSLINAIKYYHEKVLGQARTLYDITRPKKDKTLPNVLTETEVFALINSPNNLKHKVILYLLYSSGLRKGEIPKLRIEDIKSEEKQIFIKGAKGKKDRYTVLSSATLTLLRAYYRQYKPGYWLFEGVDGGQYSTSSIGKVFRKAASISTTYAWATLQPVGFFNYF